MEPLQKLQLFVMNSAISEFILRVSDLIEGVSRNPTEDAKCAMIELANTYSCIAHFVKVSGVQDFSLYKKDDFLLLRGMTSDLADKLVEFLGGTVDLSFLEAKSIPQVPLSESRNTLLCDYLSHHMEYHSNKKRTRGVMASLFYTRIRAIRNCGFTITSLELLSRVIMKSCIIENIFLSFLKTEFGQTSLSNNPLLVKKSVKKIKAATKNHIPEDSTSSDGDKFSLQYGKMSVVETNSEDSEVKTDLDVVEEAPLPDAETGKFDWDVVEAVGDEEYERLYRNDILPDAEGPYIKLPVFEEELNPLEKECLAISTELISQHIEYRNQVLHEAYRKDVNKNQNSLRSVENFVEYLKENVECASHVCCSAGIVYVTMSKKEVNLGKVVETLEGVYTMTRVSVANNFKVLVYII